MSAITVAESSIRTHWKSSGEGQSSRSIDSRFAEADARYFVRMSDFFVHYRLLLFGALHVICAVRASRRLTQPPFRG